MQVRPVRSDPPPPTPASGPGFLHALERIRAAEAVAPPSASHAPRPTSSASPPHTPPGPSAPAPPAFLDRLLGWLYQTVRGALGILWSGLAELARWFRL